MGRPAPKTSKSPQSHRDRGRCQSFHRDGTRCPNTVLTSQHDQCGAHRFGSPYAALDLSVHSKLRSGTAPRDVASLISTMMATNWPDTTFRFSRVQITPGRDDVLAEWECGPTRTAVADAAAGVYEDWVPHTSIDGATVFPSFHLSRVYPAWIWAAAILDLFGSDVAPLAEGLSPQTWANRVLAQARIELDTNSMPDFYWDEPPAGHWLMDRSPQHATTDLRWLIRNVETNTRALVTA